MTTTDLISTAANDDAGLVNATLAGNRDAFSQIVSRYQSLVCSLTYSATGNLGQSEDLAQETFITAWIHLRQLRERDKLRTWLCGIARNRINNFLRREGREPVRRAEPLEGVADKHAAEPLPVDYAISKEEAEILWRSLERIPEIYREPLILFYREHQSIENVAANLDLTEDNVKQRLSRGRKLLQEQVLAFVEGALARTNPGKTFTLSVLAALPAMTFSAKATAIGAAAAKSGAAAKTAGAMGLLGVISSPLMVLFGNYIPYRIALAGAHSDEERKHIKSFFGKICAWSFGLSMALTAVLYFVVQNQPAGRGNILDLFLTWFVGFVIIYLLAIFSSVIVSSGKRRAYYSRVLAQEYGGVFSKAAFEYRSRMEWFGLPLVHIRLGDRFDMLKKPVKGWIAAGSHAIGGLCAFGAVAVAPFSVGGLAIGFIGLGGFAFGAFPFGALAFGVCAFGGIAVGWQSFGACAFAWSAALGNFALAHQFAIGDIARAPQANTDVARQFADASLFFRWIRVVNRHWFWMNFLWIAPLAIQWWVVARKNRRQNNF